MAVDTQSKRMSSIGVASPVPSLLPVADSSVDDADRYHAAWLYTGIAVQIVDIVHLVLSGIVKIRETASSVIAIRSTATGNTKIRQTASDEVEL